MSQETINLLVGALIGILSSLLTLIVSNIFQRKNDERKRKWELEDRENNRKINAKDDKLQEAQEYLESYKQALLLLLQIETRLYLHGNPAQDVFLDHNWERTEIRERFDKIISLINFPFKRLFSIQFLNDPELQELDNKLRERFHNEMQYAFDLQMKRRHTIIDKESAEQRKQQFDVEVSKILGDMQRRLESISKNTLSNK